jgi:MoaA/NifB/PqqE/SkfB family radical SAM enzyme
VEVNVISSRAVQHGLERPNTGRLQSLWVELPGYCNLACAYCYARGGEKLDTSRLLVWEDYERILLQAQELGVDSVGIPGAGEPFLASNIRLTMSFLETCKQLGMFTTVFTTGEFITDQLAKELFEMPIELMLKGNTLDPARQDRFVSDPSRGIAVTGYGEKRNEAINRLMLAGFNDEAECRARYGRRSRMALVTSIMTSENGELSNLAELGDILRLCRKNNVIFDCDTILKRGRAITCELCTGDKELMSTLMELQKIDQQEFGNIWELSPGYVGTTCDRYMHHVYVSQYGDVHPCIGAMDVNLGNVRQSDLRSAWESAEMKIIRGRRYGGECASCDLFIKGSCNSCLGRFAKDLTNGNLLDKGCVETIGCCFKVAIEAE